MARVITLVLFVALGLAFLSRSCAFGRSAGIALINGRIVSANGNDKTTRFVAIADGKIAGVGFPVDDKSPRTWPSGSRAIDVNGLYIAATTFDRSAPTLIDGIRHVWVGQLGVGDPGNVVIMRNNPARVRPGYIPENDAIVGAVVDGVYYTARELNRRR